MSGKHKHLRRAVTLGFLLLALGVWIYNFGIYWWLHPYLTEMQVFQEKWPKLIGGGGLMYVGLRIWFGKPKPPPYTVRRKGKIVSDYGPRRNRRSKQ